MANNILMFLMDDMRYDMAEYMPEARRLIQIPGTNFTWARCNTPLCQPFRVGFLTGRWYKYHQIQGNGEQELIDDGFQHNNTLAKWVNDKAYRVAHFGKYLNITYFFEPPPTGYTTWRQVQQPGGGADQGQDAWKYDVTDGTTQSHPGIHQSQYIENNLISFIAGSEPWMALVCPTSPHTPMQPTPEDIHTWSNYTIPLVDEDKTSGGVSDKPSWIQAASPQPPGKDLQYIETARMQVRELRHVDRMIKNSIESMPQALRDRTDIFFCSDNGLYYGEHRNPSVGIAKVDLYECSAHVPMWAHGPDFPKKTTVTAPVLVGQDITKTICEIAGVTTTPWTIDGIDLKLIAANPSAYVDRHTFLQRQGGGVLVLGSYEANAVVNSTRKFIQHEVPGGDADPDRWELYDLINDPEELDNKAYAGEPWTTERNAMKVILDSYRA